VEDERDAVKILKIWSYQWRREECTTEKIQELNKIMNDEVLVVLKTLEEPHIL